MHYKIIFKVHYESTIEGSSIDEAIANFSGDTTTATKVIDVISVEPLDEFTNCIFDGVYQMVDGEFLVVL